MKNNVIILTSGLSGSSVLAGLLARAGWWQGDETFKKRDYDTHENSQLIALNRRLFDEAGYRGHYEMVFDPADIDCFADLSARIDLSDYRDFIAQCDRHTPWLWKDPRLWLTIHLWKDVFDLGEVKFIHLTRNPLQAWIAMTIRRQIQEFGYLKRYLDGIGDSNRRFLQQQGLDFLEMQYEDLVVDPDAALRRLNDFLGSALETADLQAVYRGRLYEKPKGIRDLATAALIYVRNYRERYR
ncbi:MAG: sulfotransferase [Chromatiaceae bacterium]|nr:sulfotransferase [Gammaproteobacteria bacterium]MCP5305366.1 sulfotransferase [Chromatiaceae bacterium]MCP5315325.1 sulfotransferase [Chromatiaceae bacterium]